MSEEKKYEHDGCIGCKYFSSDEVKPNTQCYDCFNAHIRRGLRDNFEPMTNADKIRNMTDEELAERFVDSLCMSKRECECDFDTITPEKCHACVLEWLQKEVAIKKE